MIRGIDFTGRRRNNQIINSPASFPRFIRFLPFLFWIMLSTAAIAEEAAIFYAGTYTRSGKSEGIYRCSLDPETGALATPTLAAKSSNPGFLAFSPDQKFLYALDESASGSGVAAFRVETGGTLARLNEVPTGGGGPTHLSVDATGRDVLVANYGGGSIACIQTNPDGSLGARTAFVQFSGSGPNRARQEGPHAHSIYADPSNRFVYSCDLGTDKVNVFRFDAGRGTLVPGDPPSAAIPPGAGPRHLAFSPNGKFAYVVNELDLTVTALARDPDTGALTVLQTLSSVPEGRDRDGVTSAAICCHPSGKWLYASNRGCDTIAVFGIGTDGKLGWIEEAPALVKSPRGFGIDPSGRWLVAAGQNDDKLAVLRIDPATGRLQPTGHFATVGSPVCVLFEKERSTGAP